MTFYLFGAGIYGVFLLIIKFSKKDDSKTDPAAWLVLAIASILWIVVVPISLIEIFTKHKQKALLDANKKANLNRDREYLTTVLQAKK